MQIYQHADTAGRSAAFEKYELQIAQKSPSSRQTKKSSRLAMTFAVVPRAGFEPTTLGLEVLCSIQLSYRGIPVGYYNKTSRQLCDRTFYL